MFGLRKKGPTRLFAHADSCKLVRTDPGLEIQWSEVETGHWRAVCQCGSEDVYEEPTNRRVRLDSLDAKTSRHGGECEFASETDADVLKIVLKVRDGMGGTTGGWSAAAAAPAGRLRTSKASGDTSPLV
jgi:hypothetical protein